MYDSLQMSNPINQKADEIRQLSFDRFYHAGTLQSEEDKNENFLICVPLKETQFDCIYIRQYNYGMGD